MPPLRRSAVGLTAWLDFDHLLQVKACRIFLSLAMSMANGPISRRCSYTCGLTSALWPEILAGGRAGEICRMKPCRARCWNARSFTLQTAITRTIGSFWLQPRAAVLRPWKSLRASSIILGALSGNCLTAGVFFSPVGQNPLTGVGGTRGQCGFVRNCFCGITCRRACLVRTSLSRTRFRQH